MKIQWTDPWCCTKELATAIFGRTTLATHSLTGTKSNAKKDSADPIKPGLDPVKLQEMIGLYNMIV
jgi:hypothetical protein